MSARLCVWCGVRVAVEGDHLLGRDIAPTVVVPSCRVCNLLGAQLWRVPALGVDGDGENVPVVVVLRRLALGCHRLGDGGRPVIELPASVFTALADVVATLADRLDDPGNR
jgi:hypothetical protein